MSITKISFKTICTSLFAAGVLSASLAANAERTLKVTAQLNTKHPLVQNIQLFKDEVEKISNNEIKVEIYDSAQLYKGSEVPQAVSSGAVDMGLVLIDEYAGTLPATGVFAVSFMFPSYEVLAKAADLDSPVRQEIDEQIRTTGTKVVWWQDYGPVQLLSKGDPVVNPEDMKGKKVRVLGKPSGDFIEALGGIPVKIGGSEQFIAYQRGTVDIGMTGTTALQSRKLYEVMDSITITNHAQTEFLIVMNDKLWQSMNEQEQEWITTAAQTAENTLRAATKENNLASEKFVEEETDMNMVRLSPEQVQAWQEAAAPAVEAFIKDTGEVGQRLVDEIKKLY